MRVVRHKAGRAADLVVGTLVPPLVSLLAVWLWYVHRPEGRRQGTALTASNLDFGSVREQRDFEWEFPVVNRASHSIENFRVDGDCSCFVVQPQQVMLAAGATGHLKATIDLLQLDWGDGETRAEFMTSVGIRCAPTVQYRSGAQSRDGSSAILST